MAAAHMGTSAGGTTTGDVKRKFDFSVSDFATIVTTTAYVDKSLMIRDVYDSSSRILITAPRRFGKSTNLDMVKRFFEIEVDACANPKPVHTTDNYKLFKDNNLQICKDIGFFKEHFGKHPVVYVDFKPLGCVSDSAKLLDTLIIITNNSLNQHNYILQHFLKEQMFSGITGFDENEFTKYVSDGITKDVDEVNLAKSFKHLSSVLRRFYGMNVFVLIDSYDALLESPLFENNKYREKMISFVKSSITQLLNNVNCVDRVLITGVIPVIGERFLSCENNIERYQFLDSHPFTKYYGLTSAEVDTVISKFIKRDHERYEVFNIINEYYGAYQMRNKQICMYNVYSVLQYVCRRTVQSYWCERREVNKFKKYFKSLPIREALQKFLVDNEFELDVSQPLSITNVFTLNSSETTMEHISVAVELFFAFLYHCGYLSVTNELRRGLVCVNIPSEEIKYEVAKALFDENNELYSNSFMNNILSVLDAFQYDPTNQDKIFEDFRESIYCLNLHTSVQFTDLISFLFLNLVTRAKYSQVMGHKFGPDGPTAVLLKNKRKVNIRVAYDDSEIAEITHQKVANSIVKNVHSDIVIAIDSKCRIAYTYYFKRGDDLREVITLPKVKLCELL